MTITPWLTKAGRFPVEHIGGIPHLNEGVDLFSPRTGIIHTTEPGARATQQAGWDAALGVFKRHWSPHFLVGAGRIAQLVQIGTRSGALVDHNVSALVQVEVVANSSEDPWLFDAATAEAVAALMAACLIEYGIPLFRPWPDGVYGKARASDPHRAEGKYGHIAGWFGHGDIPSPDTHWDPGNLKWSALFARAAEIEHDPSPAPAPVARICPAGTDHATDTGSVEWAQARLNALGFARPQLAVDGDIGVMTKNAIAHFQAAHGLLVDGALGPETIKALGG
jgi:hypothetical protein